MYEALQYYYGSGSVAVMMAIAAGAVTFIGAVLALLINFKKLSKSIGEESSWRTKVDMRLEAISNRLSEVGDLHKVLNDIQTRVTLVEREAKAAHRRLDEKSGSRD